MFYSQYTKTRNTKTWEKFRKQRNLVTKLKKNSMKTYFLERCTGGTKNVNFWKPVKPFFSKKCNSGDQNIIGVFPDSLEKAQVTPLHKKNDPLSKTNYRPVSVLPVFSKTFEKVFETQLSDFFDTIFNPFCVLSHVDMDARHVAQTSRRLA